MSQFTITVDVQGVEEVERKIKSLLSAVDSSDVEKVMIGAARIIQKDAKSRINPKRGQGNLKRAIVAKRSKARGNMFRAAFAAVDRKKKAYHAHLYEFGTKHRYHKGGKSVGKMPAKPFFWSAVQDNKGQVEREVTQGLAKLVGRAVK